MMSATESASHLREMMRMWDSSGDPRDPFAHVLVSPLFASRAALRLVRELKDKRQTSIIFDSGGFCVQQGRLTYDELCARLLEVYTKNQWGDWYVLPDWPPTSQDSPEMVERKVLATIAGAREFYNRLPDPLKERVISVVHGRNILQITACLEAFRPISSYIGFGSFGTGGSTNGINLITRKSLEILTELAGIARENSIRIHVFGIGTPPILYFFNVLEVYSFDTTAWLKAASFGNVFLPLTRGYLITRPISGRTHIGREQFEQLKTLTGHRCCFCEDFSVLSSDRWHRVMHNLASMMDTLSILESDFSHEQIMRIIAAGSPTYLRHYAGRSPRWVAMKFPGWEENKWRWARN